ncbi:MAG: hypothetical protein KDB61_05125 [Planctomycetes bacterium]|nr:hypothetical protein [Planctomycetota bacterium]
MLAFITNLSLGEMGVLIVGAVIIFGKDLPAVVIKGLQNLARLRKAVMEMWREAGLEQEFKRVKAELDPELKEARAARKALLEGKDMVSKPVEHWRKTIGAELKDVVEVGSKLDEDMQDFDEEDEPSTSGEVSDETTPDEAQSKTK